MGSGRWGCPRLGYWCEVPQGSASNTTPPSPLVIPSYPQGSAYNTTLHLFWLRWAQCMYATQRKKMEAPWRSTEPGGGCHRTRAQHRAHLVMPCPLPPGVP